MLPNRQFYITEQDKGDNGEAWDRACYEELHKDLSSRIYRFTSCKFGIEKWTDHLYVKSKLVFMSYFIHIELYQPTNQQEFSQFLCFDWGCTNKISHEVCVRIKDLPQEA